MSEAISNVYRDITLDLYNTDSSPVTVKAVQGDTSSRFLNVLLTNSGEQYTPDDEAHAQLFVIKPDGYVVYNNGTIESDTITFELTNQILAVPGKCTCQVLLWDRDYEQVVRSATPLFIDIAEKLDDESAIASTNEYGVLEEILQEIEEGGRITDNNFTDAYRAKLDMVNANAEPNQNAFSNVSVDGTTMSATEETDTLSMTLGDGLVANVTENANAFELALDLPDASELERGLLTPEDYIRFSTAQSGDHTIKEVTATAVTIELSDSTEVSLARTDGSGALTFDNIYPVGSLIKTNSLDNYPPIGTWTLADKELMYSGWSYGGTTSGGNVNVYCTCVGHYVNINFEIALPANISGLYAASDGVPVTIYSFSAEKASVSSLVPVGKRYVPGFIHHKFPNAPLTAPTPALFSISPGSTAKIDLVSWVGDIPEHSETGSRIAYVNYDAILPTSLLTGSLRYTYRRTA